MNSDSIVVWIRSITKSLGRGGHTHVAGALGISKSHLSKIMTRKSGFDDKTLRAMAWILSSKDENYLKYPIEKEQRVGSFIFRTRTVSDKEKVLTWAVFLK